jgi:hypothetical protein
LPILDVFEEFWATNDIKRAGRKGQSGCRPDMEFNDVTRPPRPFTRKPYKLLVYVYPCDTMAKIGANDAKRPSATPNIQNIQLLRSSTRCSKQMIPQSCEALQRCRRNARLRVVIEERFMGASVEWLRLVDQGDLLCSATLLPQRWKCSSFYAGLPLSGGVEIVRAFLVPALATSMAFKANCASARAMLMIAVASNVTCSP